MDSSHSAPQKTSRAAPWALGFAIPALLIPLIILIGPAAPLRWQSVSGVLLLLLVATVSWTDASSFRIPNWATYPGVLWGLVINGVSEWVSPEAFRRLGAVGLLDSFLGGLLPFIAMLVIFSMTGGGAGDVKLVAAIGVFLGLSQTISAVLCAFICAGCFALVRAIWSEGPRKIIGAGFRSVGHFLLPNLIIGPDQSHQKLLRSQMPLAPSFALGTVLMLFEVIPAEYFL